MRDAVTLRDVVEEDLPALFLHQRDPLATRMAAFPSRDRDSFDAHWRKVLADRSALKKTILFGRAIAGYVGSWDAGDERLVGYWLGREYWGKGIATRALELFLDQERTRPLRARVVKHNLGSIRVLEKCGFARVGEERSTAHGETVDELIFELAAPAAPGPRPRAAG